MTTHRGRYGLPTSGLPIPHKVTHATAPEIIRRYEDRIQTRGGGFRLYLHKFLRRCKPFDSAD
jgi:hypothetical protein